MGVGDPAAASSLHRRTDSAGSREAARATAAGDSLQARNAAVLEALRRHPWQTSLELFTAEAELLAGAGVSDRTDLARRLPLLLRRKLVCRIDPDRYPNVRPCSEAGSPCFRWALVDAAGAEEWLDLRPSSPPAPRVGPTVRRRSPAAAQVGPTLRSSAGCEACEGRGWLLGPEGVAHPCACRR